MMEALLRDMDRRLDAWICDDLDEPRARTLLCFLENVFGRFFDFRTRVCDYQPIAENYRLDWDRFTDDLGLAVREGRPFNGICPVLHVHTEVANGAYVIRSMGVRPCAMGHGLFQTALRLIARDVQGTLVIKTSGIGAEFFKAVFDLAGISPPGSDVVTLTTKQTAALGALKAYRPPAAQALNGGGAHSRGALIRRMVAAAGDGLTNHTTNYLPDALNLDENEMYVYKAGEKIKF